MELALGCAAGCQPKVAGDAAPVIDTAAFGLGAETALVVGRDESGATRVLRWQSGALTPVALREPRNGATALLAPTGHVAVVGGGPRTVELYVD